MRTWREAPRVAKVVAALALVLLVAARLLESADDPSAGMVFGLALGLVLANALWLGLGFKPNGDSAD